MDDSGNPAGQRVTVTRHDQSPRIASEIARGLSLALRELAGRGPERIGVYFNGDVVTCVMTGQPSKIERSLIAGGQTQAVIDQRRTVYAATTKELSAVVKRATGRRVAACFSDTTATPDITVVNFILAA